MVACVKDDPNSQDWWFFKPQHGEFSGSVKNGDIIRLEHVDSHYVSIPLGCTCARPCLVDPPNVRRIFTRTKTRCVITTPTMK